jgi:hypothetical protein
MTYIKINDSTYPATITSGKAGTEWGGRNMKIVTLEMEHATAASLFEDDAKWSAVLNIVEFVNGEIVSEGMVESDCSDYCLAGPITDNRDGTVTVKMGKLTDSELLAIMVGGD